MIGDLAAQGMAIILISSDLPEVLAMSDRILVMREGRQMAIFDRNEADQENSLTAAMGQQNRNQSEPDREAQRPPHELVLPTLSSRTTTRVHARLLIILAAALFFGSQIDNYFYAPLLQPHRHQHRHHRRGGRGADTGGADPQHRPLGRLHRRFHRLCGGHTTGQQQRNDAYRGGAHGHRHRRGSWARSTACWWPTDACPPSSPRWARWPSTAHCWSRFSGAKTVTTSVAAPVAGGPAPL